MPNMIQRSNAGRLESQHNTHALSLRKVYLFLNNGQLRLRIITLDRPLLDEGIVVSSIYIRVTKLYALFLVTLLVLLRCRRFLIRN